LDFGFWILDWESLAICGVCQPICLWGGNNLIPFWILDFGFWIGKALLFAESANLSVFGAAII
jgi:hypothetical protein